MKTSGKITKEMRKGTVGLVLRIQTFLTDEGEALSKKEFKTKLYAIANDYTVEQQRAAYQTLIKESDISNHKRAKIIAKALSSSDNKPEDDEDLKEVINNMADQAAENLKDKEECADDNNADFGTIKLVKKPNPVEPEKKESMMAKAAYRLRTGRRNMRINILTTTALVNRRIGKVIGQS